MKNLFPTYFKRNLSFYLLFLGVVIGGSSAIGQSGPCASSVQMNCGQIYTATLSPNSGYWSNYTGTGLTFPGSEQVWSFTPPVTGPYTFNVNQGTADADFFLMDACSNTAGNLSSGYWPGFSPGTSHTVTLAANQTVYLIADLYSGASTTVSVRVDCLGPPPPPPSNDECSGAIELPCGTTNLAGTTVNTTNISDPINCASSYGVWYKFTGDGQVTTISSTATFDHEMVISSGSCGSLTKIVCRDGSTGTETYTFTTTSGTQYYVYIGHYSPSSSTTGTFTISRTCPSPPVNDECSGAISVPVNSDLNCGNVTSGTIQYATPSSQTNDCYGTANDDVWFSFVATNTVHHIDLLNVSGSPTDLYHSVYGGTCGSIGSPLVCSDPNNSVVSGLTPGYTYYIRVYSWSSSSGATTNFNVCVGTPPPPPPNDECSGAISVPVNSDLNCGNVTSGTIQSATPSSQTNDCYGTANDDVWFSFVATNTVHHIDLLNVSGSPTDLYHSVYGGTCNSIGSPLVCSDPNNSVVSGLTPGYTYYIRVYSYSSSSGATTNFNVCVGTPPPPPSNDECSGAIELPCGTTNLAGTTVNTTNISDPINCASSYGVWYKFTGDGQETTISSTATFDHEMVISSGGCGSLTSIVCRDQYGSTGTETYTFTTTSGTQYYVYIGHWSTSSSITGTFTISRTCPSSPPVNDECSGAIELPCGTTNLAGTTVNTTNISDPINCASSYGVWYKFTGDGQETTISSTATFDHEMVIYSGSCGSLTNIVCRDWSTGTETYTFTTTSGTQYYVYIGHWSTSSSITGTFTISRTCPSNTGDDIIPTACATATYTLQPNSTIHFYDDGGPGGECFTQGAPGNYANSNCITMTTICAAPGQFLIVDFLALSMMNTISGFDWLVIYDGPGTSGPQLFNNRAGQADNDRGSYCYFYDNNDALSLCSTSQCLTFEFFASSTVDYEGWDALVSSVPIQCSPLPVELSHFSASCDDDVEVLWATESELNADKFIVEKSRNGVNWELVDELAAAGNSNSHLSYSTTDKKPYQGVSYYRLRQVDFDGKEKIYGPISVSCTDNGNSINVYPNPNNGNFTIEINSSIEIENANLQLVDLTGKLVSSRIIQITKGVTQVSIGEKEYLSTGTYILKIVNKGEYFGPVKVVVK